MLEEEAVARDGDAVASSGKRERESEREIL